MDLWTSSTEVFDLIADTWIPLSDFSSSVRSYPRLCLVQVPDAN